MDIDEAQAWLRGERSMCNIVPQDPFETWQERIARSDAAMTEQAYWIVRAEKEGLMTTTQPFEPAYCDCQDINAKECKHRTNDAPCVYDCHEELDE